MTAHLAAACVALVAGCDRGPSLAEKELASLQRRTLPAEGRVLWRTPLHTAPWSVSGRWQIEVTGWTWPRYTAWLGGQLTDYAQRPCPPCPGGIAYSHALVGDIFALSVDPTDLGPPLRVTLELTCMPY